MKRTIQVTLIGGFAAAGVLSGAGTSAAAPDLPVQQSPVRATGISGLLVPGSYPVSVRVSPTADRNVVSFSGSAAPEACATTIGRSVLRVDWINTGTGKRGSVAVKSCDNGWNPEVPARADASTGAGKVTFSSTVHGSREFPSAGLPAMPGGGSFMVP